MDAEILQNLMVSTSNVIGQDFFDKLVVEVTRQLSVDICYVGRLNQRSWEVTTLAIAKDGEMTDNFAYSLADTPCAQILNRDYCRFSEGVCAAFPNDHLLAAMEIEGYVGFPLLSVDGEPIGIFICMKCSPIEDVDATYDFLKFFARRCESELERMIATENLAVSEHNFRTLVDVVPDALLLVNDMQVIEEANPSAAEVFGYAPKELIGLNLEKLVPEDYREEHARLASGFFHKSITYPHLMAQLRPLGAIRKDGSTVTIGVMLRPYTTDGRTKVLVIIRTPDMQNQTMIGANPEDSDDVASSE